MKLIFIIIVAIVAAVAAFAEPFKVLGYTFGEQPAADAPTSHRWCHVLFASVSEDRVYAVNCIHKDFGAWKSWESRLIDRYGEPDRKNRGNMTWCLDNGALIQLDEDAVIWTLFDDVGCPVNGKLKELREYESMINDRNLELARRALAEIERADDEDF